MMHRLWSIFKEEIEGCTRGRPNPIEVDLMVSLGCDS